MEKFVKVPIQRYIELENNENVLSALEGAGVDNWQGYGDSMEMFEEFDETNIVFDIIEE